LGFISALTSNIQLLTDSQLKSKESTDLDFVTKKKMQTANFIDIKVLEKKEYAEILKKISHCAIYRLSCLLFSS